MGLSSPLEAHFKAVPDRGQCYCSDQITVCDARNISNPNRYMNCRMSYKWLAQNSSVHTNIIRNTKFIKAKIIKKEYAFCHIRKTKTNKGKVFSLSVNFPECHAKTLIRKHMKNNSFYCNLISNLSKKSNFI